MQFLGAYCGATLVGYGILETSTGDIPQIAVSAEHRRHGVGRCIFNHLLTLITAEAVRIANIDIKCDSLLKFLECTGMSVGGGHYEMQLLL
jgi:ribosomal protein S18 acetylase RimI-like enzyme